MFGCDPAVEEEVQDAIFLHRGFHIRLLSSLRVFFAGIFWDRSHPGSKPSSKKLEQPQRHLRSVGGEGRMNAGVIH